MVQGFGFWISPCSREQLVDLEGVRVEWSDFRVCQMHMQTLVIYKLGFNQDNSTFTSILPIKIVMCSKCPWTKFIKHDCSAMTLPPNMP